MANSTIVVGIDGSDSALRAARWAATEAVHRSARLRLCCCDDASIVLAAGSPGVVLPQSFFDAVREQGERWLRRAGDVAREAAPGVRVETEFRSFAAPAPVLIEESRRTSLISLGHRGLGGFTGLLVGSVTISVSAHAACPVAVIRGREEIRPDAPVVVGVDGPADSTAVLRFAFESAAHRGVPLRAVHADPTPVTDEAPARHLVDGRRPTARAEEESLSEAIADLSERFPEVQVQRSAAVGEPASTLVEHSEHAQLVVVGARGRGGFTGLLLGSTSQQLVHHASCPVVIAR
ncbi:universal stress protein [Saccharopolyspora sp. MS10]|uniref:universal stress protein n=1 Tax=Saccharopolyspora sp. MS10 TaxID=3385973 RepID=UPI00399EF6BD